MTRIYDAIALGSLVDRVSLPAQGREGKAEMGVELYSSEFLANFESLEERLVEAVRMRDLIRTSCARQARAQDKVDRLIRKQYEVGFFRDVYDETSILAQLGLSWWSDVAPRLDAHDHLHPACVEWLLREVQSRRLLPSSFLTEEQTSAMALLRGGQDLMADRLIAGYSSSELEWFVSRKLALMAFLTRSLSLGQPIVCSL